MRKRMHDWARVGAEHRMRELQAEMDAIVATFPFLGKLRRKIGKVVKANAPRPRKTYKLSAETRKAPSERMAKRWLDTAR